MIELPSLFGRCALYAAALGGRIKFRAAGALDLEEPPVKHTKVEVGEALPQDVTMTIERS